MKHRVIGHFAGALAALLVLGQVSVTFEGMKAQQATFNTSEGSTQFIYEGKMYFYVSDPGAAEMEVKHFHGQ